jgi:pimeloyl-ACP methyl ester carboxylesterase
MLRMPHERTWFPRGVSRRRLAGRKRGTETALRRSSILTLLAVVGLVGAHTAPAAATAGVTCQSVTRTVTLSALDVVPRQLAGWLCWRGALNVTTVQVLVHGLSYDHHYWDFPAPTADQSYVAAATAAGYATFNIDRIGVGASTRPGNGLVLTTGSAAYVLHQVVQALRAGQIGGNAFHKVITVGHSFGSQAVAKEAGVYGDVDGVILSGSLHDTTVQTFTHVLPQFYPAQLDPKFGLQVPAGYLTTIPGTRGAIFYNPANVDLAVVATDEQLKQTATDGEIATVTNGNLETGDITAPVLVAVGQTDALFCNATLSCADAQAVLARESGDFAAAACLDGYVLPMAGHSINLHVNAPDWFAAALDWTDRRVGTTNRPPAQPC